MTGILPYGYFIYDGYIYYPDDMKSVNLNGWNFNSVSLYRVHMDEITIKNREVVAYNICYFGYLSAGIFNGCLYYLPCEPEYVGEHVDRGSNYEQSFQVYNEHQGEAWQVDLNTLDEEPVFLGIGYNIVDIVYADNKSFVFPSTGSGYDDLENYDAYSALYVYDRSSGELYQIIYYG